MSSTQKEFTESVVVDGGALETLGREVLKAYGVEAEDARYVSWHLVQANVRGTDSHGIARLPHYVRRLKAGSILPRPAITFTQQGAAVGTVDGGHGLGHVVMRRATTEAIRLANEAGAGWVAVKNSSHCGALAPFGLELARHNLIGLVFTHVDPMVLPHGSLKPFSGTNPICITAPGDQGKTFCLDMATSVVPWNRVENAANERIPIPEGWGVDREGKPTTEPKSVNALYPVGGYKGSGLGIMIDVLCSMLTGSPFGPEIPKMYGDLKVHRRLGGLVGAIRIAPFGSPEQFARRMAEMAVALGALQPAPGVDRVRFPGEPELETEAVRSREGIPLGLRTFNELNQYASEVGVPVLAGRAGATNP